MLSRGHRPRAEPLSRAIERPLRQGVDCDSVRHEAVGLLQGAVRFDRWCWPLADPDTLIPLKRSRPCTTTVQALPRVLELGHLGADLAAMDVVARRPSSSTFERRDDDAASSPRWDEVLGPVGIGDEAVVACRDESGCWGWLKAYRDRSESPFLEDDLALLRDGLSGARSSTSAQPGARRSRGVGSGRRPAGRRRPRRWSPSRRRDLDGTRVDGHARERRCTRHSRCCPRWSTRSQRWSGPAETRTVSASSNRQSMDAR